MANDIPIACTLSASDYRQRLAEIAALSRDALRRVEQRGLTLDLRYAPEAAARVRMPRPGTSWQRNRSASISPRELRRPRRSHIPPGQQRFGCSKFETQPRWLQASGAVGSGLTSAWPRAQSPKTRALRSSAFPSLAPVRRQSRRRPSGAALVRVRVRPR